MTGSPKRRDAELTPKVRGELLRIRQVENTPSLVEDVTSRHPITQQSEVVLRKARLRACKRLLQRTFNRESLDLRVSKKSLSRALRIMNAIILHLERENFSAKITTDGKTVACIFGQEVPFYLYEKVRLKLHVRRSYLQIYRCKYEPTGLLEFRAGTNYSTGASVGDSDDLHLEFAVHLCVAALMRQAWTSLLASRQAKKLEIQRERRQRRLAEQSKRIAKEQKKLHRLVDTVATWRQSLEIQFFIGELEKIDPKSSRCPRRDIAWIKKQAKRLDPFEPDSKSWLDRKRELFSQSRRVSWPMLLEQTIFGSNLGMPMPHRSKHSIRERR